MVPTGEWMRIDSKGCASASQAPSGPTVCILNTLNDVLAMQHLGPVEVTKTVARLHMNYDTRLEIAKRLGILPQDVLDRFSVHQTKELYDRFIQISDSIVTVDPFESLEGATYCPPQSGFSFGAQTRPRRSNGIVLIGGRLTDPIKGLDRILDEILVLRQRLPGVEVRCLSSANDEVRKLFSANGLFDITFIDWVHTRKDLFSILREVDVFLTMPHYEPFGLMVVEALCCGVIPVSTSHGIAAVLYENLEELSFCNVGRASGCAAEIVADLVANYGLRCSVSSKLQDSLHIHFDESPTISDFIL